MPTSANTSLSSQPSASSISAVTENVSHVLPIDPQPLAYTDALTSLSPSPSPPQSTQPYAAIAPEVPTRFEAPTSSRARFAVTENVSHSSPSYSQALTRSLNTRSSSSPSASPSPPPSTQPFTLLDQPSDTATPIPVTPTARALQERAIQTEAPKNKRRRSTGDFVFTSTVGDMSDVRVKLNFCRHGCTSGAAVAAKRRKLTGGKAETTVPAGSEEDPFVLSD
ncbi:hypothetical protein NP233_g3357 [Leucocoprinus birnbaumii]|uniref:Uncharacterized protein n=1 Tax=Leucocoprinus birnbaumii TaxID=56174 RepID=A0AAD5VZ92_9AGAR|nr:hypothetical protein NP233_g3357 [Leucocoprinus birnbaumii]